MSTNQRSFDQVKSILGKLDRNIDAARQRRTQVRPPTPAAPIPPVSSTDANQLIGLPSTPRPAAQPAAPVPQAPGTPAATGPGSVVNGRSIYGRAQPLRPTSPNPPPLGH